MLKRIGWLGIIALLVWVGGGAIGFAVTPDSGTALFSDDFEAGLSEQWVEQGFPSIAHKNVFALAVEPNGNHYLNVESRQSYSAKGVYFTFSPEECPHVSWRWRITNVVKDADLTRKEGDDAAAKLYVVFDGPSLWNPLDKRILVYVWDNTALLGAIYKNVWLPEKERMVILETGPARVEKWVDEHVHLFDDFKRAFPHEEPGNVEGLAFLADTDNTQSHVSAGFDDFMIRCTEPEK